MDSTTNDNIFDLSKDYLIKKANVKLMIIASVILVIAIVMIVLSFSLKLENTGSSVLLAIGVCIAIFAIVLMFTGKKRWVTKATGSKVEKVCLYFEDKDVFNLTSELERGNYSNIGKYDTKDSSGLRVIALIADDGSFAALRLEKYIPYVFEHITETIIKTNDDATKICDCFKKMKNKK
ncbi:MAG: hypothetical protein LBP67_03815 [Bacteroidales bacterium]|jgi:hypothetical protein|nr:hypothetical protein [Bacteroidales bacterium]